MLRYREEHLLTGAARRLKRGIDDGTTPGEVFSRVQDHVISAARAHVERLVLEAFVDKVRSLDDTGEGSGNLEGSGNKVALGLLCDLYALTTIEADRGWFMEHGRLSSTRSKAITREIAGLLRRIRPIAVDLVDAFDVPPEMLGSSELLTSGS
jgi:acyl-CoA oxidase